MNSEPNTATGVEFSIKDSRSKLIVISGDIATDVTDVIVHPTNEYLTFGGGVGRSLLAHGGTELYSATREYVNTKGPLKNGAVCDVIPGKAKNCKFIFHTAVPVWQSGKAHEDKVLISCVAGCLALAEAKPDVKSISFPAIGTGNCKFPVGDVAGIMRRSIQAYFKEQRLSKLDMVRIVIRDPATYDTFVQDFQADVIGFAKYQLHFSSVHIGEKRKGNAQCCTIF
jgi:O-acetyl-ADP-ribose deacetylase (regulator of RNase III)